MKRAFILSISLGLWFFSMASIAHQAAQCRYTFTAPAAAELAQKYPELAGFGYVTYVVGGDNLHATAPLSIARGEHGSVTADCAPYLLYATFTKKHVIIPATSQYRCPTYAMGKMGVLLNQVSFTGPVRCVFDKDVVQAKTGGVAANPVGAPDLAKFMGRYNTEEGPANQKSIPSVSWTRVPDSQCRKVVDGD